VTSSPIAEVVRDLLSPIGKNRNPNKSYSERQLYEAALDRLSREIAVVQHVTETEAVKEIEASSPRAAPRRQSRDGKSRPTARRTPMRMAMATMPLWRMKPR